MKVNVLKQTIYVLKQPIYVLKHIFNNLNVNKMSL